MIYYDCLACSGNGFIESVGRDSFCLCFPGWQGQCCDQPDCSCHNSNYQDCSGNGVCRAAIADNNPTCSCSQGWRGSCCENRIPVRRSGDPHLSTADGTVIKHHLLHHSHITLIKFFYSQDLNLIILELENSGTAEARRMTLVYR